MPYFYAIEEAGRVEISGADARHLARSLRARPGERISVIDPAGRLLDVRLESVSERLVSGRVEAAAPHRPEPAARVTVALALLPAAGLDAAIARCTELGAAAFVLVAAARSVAGRGRPERWAAVCREAAMLAGRLVVPEVAGPVAPAELDRVTPGWVLLDRTSGRRLADLAEPRDITLAIGPEGGWTSVEVLLAAGRTAGLGPRNLRAENAAAAALTVALAVRGDL